MAPEVPTAAEVAVDDASATVALSGAWTLKNLEDLAERTGRAPLREHAYRVDARALTALDTAGALLLLRTLRRTGRPWGEHAVDGLRPAHERLLSLVAKASLAEGTAREHRPGLLLLVARVGAAMERVVHQGRDLLGFVGLTLEALGGTLIGRRKLRLTSTVFHMEQTGLDAVPIVALLSFLVGAVVAFLGATVLRDFGAQTYTIELVGYSVLREFGALLTAILLAGRSGSAFTAQIGSMKSREEIDAIQTLGMNPMELLVLPRVLALLVMLPVLTIVAMLAGILGGGLVGTMSLDLTAGMFLSHLRESIHLRHFWVGMIKAPVFAFLIAVVGCHEGLRVEGSAESVGRRTTSSVVQSIFLVILFDALFAIWFMEMEF
jgi:phospholipid/cholesterol/gamma-HCH transport system permease protein